MGESRLGGGCRIAEDRTGRRGELQQRPERLLGPAPLAMYNQMRVLDGAHWEDEAGDELLDLDSNVVGDEKKLDEVGEEGDDVDVMMMNLRWRVGNCA